MNSQTECIKMIISYLALVMDADKVKFLEAWQADLVILRSHGAAR